MTKRHALDHELVYKSFSTWVDRYWLGGQVYIAKARQTTPTIWESFEWLAKKHIDRKKKEGYLLTPDEIKRFLDMEASLPSCSEEAKR